MLMPKQYILRSTRPRTTLANHANLLLFIYPETTWTQTQHFTLSLLHMLDSTFCLIWLHTWAQTDCLHREMRPFATGSVLTPLLYEYGKSFRSIKFGRKITPLSSQLASALKRGWGKLGLFWVRANSTLRSRNAGQITHCNSNYAQ